MTKYICKYILHIMGYHSIGKAYSIVWRHSTHKRNGVFSVLYLLIELLKSKLWLLVIPVHFWLLSYTAPPEEIVKKQDSDNIAVFYFDFLLVLSNGNFGSEGYPLYKLHIVVHPGRT